MRLTHIITAALLLAAVQNTQADVPASAPAVEPPRAGGPDSVQAVGLIFDTDMGNDIDDALALGVIHALQSRGECRLLAVTTTKDNQFCAPFIDLVNHFYGRGDIPIGVVRQGKTPEDNPYLRVPAQAMDQGRQRYPHQLRSSAEAPEAVAVLREVLAAQPDRSVAMVVVGFSTNLARLLDSRPDAHSPLDGPALVNQKVRLLSIMAGMYAPNSMHKEYNVVMDLPSACKLYAEWPTPIVASGYEIGSAVKFPAVSIERDFAYVAHHPLREAYGLYRPMPYDRETWDLTSVLYAVRPDRGYFGLSQPGVIRVNDQGLTNFAPSPGGRHRYLTMDDRQVPRVCEALVQLASQPPDSRPMP